MRLRVNSSAALLLGACCAAHAGTFAVLGTNPGAWPLILASAGHIAAPASAADILVAPMSTAASQELQTRIRAGAAVILEGSSPLAASFGFRPGSETVPVLHLVDVWNPSLPVIWSRALEIPKYEVPSASRVFAKERWTGAPLVAGLKVGAGAVLWVAAPPGKDGYERFPYLMQSLASLGFGPAVRSSRLWAFFDYSYRTRADVSYLAKRWRAAGIAALHVASWHFYDGDTERDEYLRRLIEACHRNRILVYAWVELPHVSEKFWADHPAWREKTAVLQDAQLDWRKLMNLQNRECAAAIRGGLNSMISRFDWDGINLAELYFESLEGASNPARFTPMNDDVRGSFQARAGWDPIELWSTRKDAPALRSFLDFRAGLARAMQQEWLSAAQAFRSGKPYLDIVLTHVDDQFDKGMKDSIGADAAGALPLLDKSSFSFLIEDPATVWDLGPRRYPEIAKRYEPLTAHPEKLAIDINIVDRYQDVYPTRQQTGTELFELVNLASGAFPRVALYFENSILQPDMQLLAAAAATVSRFTVEPSRTTVKAASDVEIAWSGRGAMVDGKPWPFLSTAGVRLPAGSHVVEPAPASDGLTISDLNARLRSAGIEGGRIHFEYASDSRAIVEFSRPPVSLAVDAREYDARCLSGTKCSILLPAGEHRVTAN